MASPEEDDPDFAECWARGDLTYALQGWQREARDWFWNSDAPIMVLLCSRQIGKTTLGAAIVNEIVQVTPFLLDRPANIKIAASTGVDLAENLEPAMSLMRDLAPSWAKSTYHAPSAQKPGRYVWPNGGTATVVGVNNGHENKLRGRTKTDLFWVEEASTVDRLEYLCKSVARWQLFRARADRRHEGRLAKLLLTLTPAETPAHESTAYVKDAEALGRLFTRTIHQSGMDFVTPEIIAEFARECGGEQSTAWRREALCQFVVEETRAVVPEFERECAHIVEARERPRYFVPRVAMDVGYKDLTFVVLGYFDFEAGLDVITHEVVLQHSTSSDINVAVAKAELEAFGKDTPKGRVRPDRVGRFVDAPAIVVADLRRMLGIKPEATPMEGTIEADLSRLVAPGEPIRMRPENEDEAALSALGWCEARKDDADAALNALRVRVRDRRLRIHPRCTHLISHLRHAIWNKARTSYERSGGMGHFDGVDAAKYFVRHLNRATNPFPLLQGHEHRETHKIPKALREQSKSEAAILARAMFGRR